MKLSKETEYLVLDNLKLVYHLVNKLEVSPTYSEYNDFISLGTLALIKAAITFDSSKNFKFATYASKCIHNEIFMYYRKTKKYATNISFGEPIPDTESLTLEDTLEASNPKIIDEIINKDYCIHLISIILNYLKGKKRLIMLFQISNIYQRKIADILHISQSYVSRLEAKNTLEFRSIVNCKMHYKEVFSMAIIGDEYIISFSSKDIKDFNKIFANLLQNLKSTEDLPNFTVTSSKERTIIQIPAHPESFYFIALIIKEIDDFSMTFVSNNSTSSVNNPVSHEVNSDDKDVIPLDTQD